MQHRIIVENMFLDSYRLWMVAPTFASWLVVVLRSLNNQTFIGQKPAIFMRILVHTRIQDTLTNNFNSSMLILRLYLN